MLLLLHALLPAMSGASVVIVGFLLSFTGKRQIPGTEKEQRMAARQGLY